ncbi:uncharacterized protein MYCFIDRAFT_177580 [Pseudocercospora fijiensis CIRAD86]|uniref:Uncharacterized protein n=1 Tax=Pseudocercospora fijiensis (strain CIRAD86) TaxID=383855 RepID=M2YSF4_PSEFD|nr:uncharacterized protein MYCFIDRAFT_177580 [Pseudocercospora fijiensis CIRAD86]EME80650.1 hypothetical protein MYCFIDRAFT_177580 [Pseudocercospora fijiensis CIRAD86]
MRCRPDPDSERIDQSYSKIAPNNAEAKHNQHELSKILPHRKMSALAHLPGEIRNRIYGFALPAKEVYTLQYPRVSGGSDLPDNAIFGLDRQIRHEALTFHYPDSKIIVEPRPGFILHQIPRCLSQLPFDVLKVAKEIEVKMEILPPLEWTRWWPGILLQLSFTVTAEGLYISRAYYRSTSEAHHNNGRTLSAAGNAELRTYIDEQVRNMEELMLTRLQGRDMEKATDSPRISIDFPIVEPQGPWDHNALRPQRMTPYIRSSRIGAR